MHGITGTQGTPVITWKIRWNNKIKWIRRDVRLLDFGKSTCAVHYLVIIAQFVKVAHLNNCTAEALKLDPCYFMCQCITVRFGAEWHPKTQCMYVGVPFRIKQNIQSEQSY